MISEKERARFCYAATGATDLPLNEHLITS